MLGGWSGFAQPGQTVQIVPEGVDNENVSKLGGNFCFSFLDSTKLCSCSYNAYMQHSKTHQSQNHFPN
jgi:hypothetical protein